MVKKYYDQFMVWQLHNRREIVYTICDGEEVMRVPGKFLRDFCL
jgi:hypothetical protein